MLAINLSYIAFIALSYVPPIPHFLRLFKSWLDVEFCQRLFLHLLKWSRILSLIFFCAVLCLLIYVWCTIIHPWNKTVMYAFLNLLLNSVFNNLVENFCVNIHKRDRPILLFFCYNFIWFWKQGNTGFIEWVW
jgi:hypothetical protein